MPTAPGHDPDEEKVPDRLQHVYWIGGGSGSGKSTIARHLADRYGLVRYETDRVMRDHARRAIPEQAPYLSAFAAMDADERWVNRSPREMLDTFRWFHGEGFDLIIVGVSPGVTWAASLSFSMLTSALPPATGTLQPEPERA